MKNLVLTASFGDRPFKKYTIDSQQRYAEKIGADFRCVEEFDVDDRYDFPIGRKGNKAYLIKLLVVQQALEEYDRVIWFDDTCVVSSDTPNLFDIVPYELFGAHNEGILGWVLADEQTKSLYERHDMPNIITSQNYFNTGVMVVSQHHQTIFSDNVIIKLGQLGHFKNAYPEQTYLNYLVAKHRLGYFALPSIFNRMAVNIPEIEGERVNYETFKPKQTFIAANIKRFNFLNENTTQVGMLNGAYIYHITSMYEPQPRYDLIKKLYEIKVDK